MAKKKKKTIASTKKVEKTAEEKENIVQQESKKSGRGLKKMLKMKKRSKPKKVEKIKKKEKEVSKPVPDVAKETPVIKESPKKEEPVIYEPKHKKEPKPKRKREPMSPANKQKIRGGILITIGLFTILFIGYFLFGKYFNPQDLAEILPANNTVATIEFNIDPGHNQPQQFMELMSKYPAYQKENIISLMNILFPVNYEDEISPWLGRKVGLALYSGTELKNGSGLMPIFFVESRDHGRTDAFFSERTMAGENITTTDYNGYKISEFTVSQPISYTYINNYLVFTEDQVLLKDYLDSLNSGEERLINDANYRKVANNMPQGSLIFAYVDFDKLFEVLSADQTFIAQKGQDLLALRPFISIFKAEGLTVFVDKNRFSAQTFTAIDNEALDGENYITFNEKYQGELLDLASDDLIFLAGGHDMTKELNRLEDIFKSGTKTPALVFDGVLEAQKQTYFGKDIDLKNDIYPLLTGEYLVTMENNFDKPIVSVFLDLGDKNKLLPKFEKVVNAFVEVSGVFTPRVQDVTLPDGTIAQEIVASPEKIDKSTSKHNGVLYTSLQIGETGLVIHYAILGDYAAITTNEDAIKNIIDRSTGEQSNSLKNSKFYTENLQPVLRTADEVLHVKLGAITEALGLNDNPDITPYFVPFTNFTITKNYFDDGISTIYLVDVI